ncbi:MAG: hypothetical protein UV70_C0010G0009 [Parcubacteria group bacterium GW2011_GWA2_43_13]|nr:MAG: hypothetical protein UV70_C0010G0009 [Parcubacteria group bacterium GW2011_GWA2_43_13]
MIDDLDGLGYSEYEVFYGTTTRDNIFIYGIV